MTNRVEDIQAAFDRVKVSAARVMKGEESHKDQTYQDIFALNNEIGRMGRTRPATMPRMKELQAYVNMITVGIKYDKVADLREGISATEKSLIEIKKEFEKSP